MYVSEFSAIYGFFTFKYVHFHQQLELGLFPFGIISNAECVEGQILRIELLDSFGHQCQKLSISCCNKDITSF